ncbi:UbiE/COQ5 family methyltransferase [Violaceomyces palustris]|uniref:UbiE/COQ5 family methyltransferase n=1 Tax=Violaceomyces palustris TaxID=1673888 RepID=A0ACD0NUF6_9BASI|nr:UbiE/COQ5 family methyltransferase [Violaceomyces palustris]
MSSAGTNTATYTQGHGPSVLAAHAARTAVTSCSYLLPLLKPDFSILDVGCGPGTITSSLASYVPLGSIIGIDTSKAVIDSACSRSPLPANCHFQVGDAYSIPFPDSSFDVVHAHQVLIHLPDPVRALKEMKRVCRPGGLVAVRDGDWDSIILFPHIQPLSEWKAISEAIFRANASEPNAGRHLLHWASEADFDLGQASYSAGTMTFSGGAGGAGTWGTTWAERVLADDWRDKAVAGGHASASKVEEMAEAWRSWSQRPDAVYSIVCGEMICKK